MGYENFIGLRYLMAKERGCVVSIITLISIAGVTLGVTAMIVVLSVMGGFKQDLKEKILGTRAHMVVDGADGAPVEEPERIIEASEEFDEIVGAAPFLDAEVMASSPTNLNGVMLRGIEPERIGEVSDLDQALLHEKAKGKLSNLKHPGRPVSELRKEGEEPPESFPKGLETPEPFEETDAGELVPEKGTIEPSPADPEPPAGGSSPDAGTGTSKETGVERSDEGASSGVDEPERMQNGDPESKSDSDRPIGPDIAPSAGTGNQPPELDGAVPPVAPGGEETGGADETPDLPSVADESSDDGAAEMPPIAGGESDADSGESNGEGEMPPVAGAGGESGEEPSSELPGILIGKELAKSLKVGLGDELNVVTPEGEMGPTGPIPQSRPFRVVGVFYTGMYEYDANHAYTALDDTKDFLGRERVSGVELKASNVELAIPLAEKLQKKLEGGYEVKDWKEMNRSLFYALKLEKIAMFVVLTFIILVASFSIIAMLIMIVLEKKRDISVLKSMGVTDWGIMRIFMFQGVVIGAVGAALGLLAGLGICFLLIEFGWPLNSKVYYIATLPVDIDIVEVIMVVSATVLISFVATIYPSWKAAQLTPVEGLRYE